MNEPCRPSQHPLRPASHVMRLSTMGASFPTRLSFLRRILRALHGERAQVSRPVWKMDDQGFGHAVYSVTLGGHTYSLVAFSRDLPADQRTDRVIATAWDAAFVLYDGVPDAAQIARLERNAPLQEAGRMGPRDLVLSRANKSVRLFEHVTNALAQGRQPDAQSVADIGYLMRTTAVYGNGKFGLADRQDFCDRPVMSGPFAAEMLTVWLIRGFTHDLVEHVGGGTLDRALKRHLGIGNSTGLGMAPFLVSHPILLNNWVLAREAALAECRQNGPYDAEIQARLLTLAARVQAHLAQWIVADAGYSRRIAALRLAWPAVCDLVAKGLPETDPYGALLDYAAPDQSIAVELQELIVALVLEAHPNIVDGFSDCMDASLEPTLDGRTSCDDMRAQIEKTCAWALGIDFSSPDETYQFWYVSEEKQEPRLGLRASEEGADLESPLDIARRIQQFHHALKDHQGPLSAFLMTAPEHCFAARRVQTLARFAYAEIQDNLIGKICLPIDMLRFKLAMFGASKFDPKSDRWTRITLAQGAPLFDEVAQQDADDWWLPVFAP